MSEAITTALGQAAVVRRMLCRHLGQRKGHRAVDEMSGFDKDAVRRACRCLYLAVDSSIASDVETKVDAALDALNAAEATIARVRALAEEWDRPRVETVGLPVERVRASAARAILRALDGPAE